MAQIDIFIYRQMLYQRILLMDHRNLAFGRIRGGAELHPAALVAHLRA